MPEKELSREKVQLELSFDVLCRLIREKDITASELRCLNEDSSQACWTALKLSLLR